MSRALNPYRGLLPFEPEHAAQFFGRDREVSEITALLERRRFLIITGRSGSGKSSLVNAGVIPMLLGGLAPGLGPDVLIAKMRPGDAPLIRLQESLSASLKHTVDFDVLTMHTFGLVDSVRQVLGSQTLVIIVDQFEEIFAFRKLRTFLDGGAETDRFVTLLLRAADQREVHIYVVLTMRSEFLGECATFRGLPEAINAGSYLVPTMSRLQLQEAIEGPLRSIGVDIHPALVQRLLNESTEELDYLPVIQHFLWRVFDVDTPMDSFISQSSYEKVGGLRSSIDFDAENLFARFSEEQQFAIARMFQSITSVGDSDRPLRQPNTVAWLADVCHSDLRKIREIADPFAERGLLTMSSLEAGVLDLSHECIIWKWRRLAHWVHQEAAAAKSLRFIRDLSERKQWLSGSVLSEALRMRDTGSLASGWPLRYLSEEELSRAREWLDASASRERAEERRIHRTRILLRVAVIVVVAAVVWALSVVFGFWPRISE